MAEEGVRVLSYSQALLLQHVEEDLVRDPFLSGIFLYIINNQTVAEALAE